MRTMTRTLLLTAFCCLFAFTSCKKSGANLFAGDYSFKTSGEVSITAKAETNDNNLPIPASLDVNLSNNIGQMNICISDKQNDKVIVVINYINGDVITTTGTCDGRTIYIDEYQHDILPVSISTMFTSYSVIKASAVGQIYDENLIIFDMAYEGIGTVGSITYKIKDKDIKIVAYRN